MQFRVGLAQIAPALGDLAGNLQRHLDVAAEAVARGGDLLVFPELSLTGYRLGDRAFDVALRADAGDPTFAALLAASEQLDLVVSFVEVDERHRHYIAAVYLSGGRRGASPPQGLPAHLRRVRRGPHLRPRRPGARLRHPLRPRRAAHLRGLLARQPALPAVAGRGRPLAAAVGLHRARRGRGDQHGRQGAGHQPCLRPTLHRLRDPRQPRRRGG